VGVLLIVTFAMMTAALVGCGDVAHDSRAISAKSSASTPVASTGSQLAPGLAMRVPAAVVTQRDLPVAARIGILDEVNQHPDPQMRMAALEVWAAGDKGSLDPVTHALVDTDEAVRARAQELLEQELLRW
jgi:hypothetical protein